MTMTFVRSVLIGLILITGQASAAGKNANSFISQTAGFSFEKVSSWNFTTIETWASHKAALNFKDKDFENLVKQRASTPLVIVLKFKEPTNKINPGFQVILRPLGVLEGRKPVELMEISLEGMKRALKGFKVISKPEEQVIGGLKGAVAKVGFKFSHPSLASTVDSESKIWIVPRSKFMFLISGNGMLKNDSKTEAEFDQMVNSFKFEKL